jgi:hypothetical protein
VTCDRQQRRWSAADQDTPRLPGQPRLSAHAGDRSPPVDRTGRRRRHRDRPGARPHHRHPPGTHHWPESSPAAMSGTAPSLISTAGTIAHTACGADSGGPADRRQRREAPFLGPPGPMLEQRALGAVHRVGQSDPDLHGDPRVACRRRSSLAARSADEAEERPYFVDEQAGLLERGEVTTALDLVPVAQVAEPGFDPPPG